jgi:subtilisin family serine protease
MRRIKTIWIASSTVLAAALLSAGSIAPAAAQVDGAAAAGLCATSYPGVTGPDQLSPCQWDMKVVNALAAHEKATGLGVKVGVIDGGVDFAHPDLTGAIDVGLSCSFINSTTPTGGAW